MATKAELLKQAQAAGLVGPDVTEDDMSGAELTALLKGDTPAWEGSRSASEPLVAPDGHVNVSQEDIDARDT